MIKDYSELISEISTRSDISNIADRADMFVGLAETALSKRLRIAEMEKAISLMSDAKGIIDLPQDYQEMRSIRISDRELERESLVVILNKRQCGYAIKGQELHSTFPEATHEFIYYASIPSLSENGSNWLLESDPELYLYAVLFQIYSAEMDIEKAQAVSSYLSQLIDEINNSDHIKRHAGTRINLGIVP